MNLKRFGAKLKQLRTAAGLSQEALLYKLDLIHTQVEAGALPIDTQLIWKWEAAYTYQGRQWKPQRQYVLYLIEVFADQLTLDEAQQWAAQAGYQLGKHDLEAIFPPDLDWPPTQTPPLPTFHINREGLEAEILAKIKQEQLQCLVLWGPGGVGKTTLAVRLTKLLMSDFPDGGVIWVPIQSEDTATTILESVAKDLGITLSETSLAKQARRIHSRLRKKRCLLVLDDVSFLPNSVHLRLGSETSQMLCTTRDRKVANLLEAPLFPVKGMTETESLQFVANWVDNPTETKELIRQLGGLPLALKLCRAQLEDGIPLEELLTTFREKAGDLSVLDLDDPSTRYESLTLCFDLSYRLLPPETRQHFVQLGYFLGRHIPEAAISTVWGVSRTESQKSLRRLVRFALLERTGINYQLHLLLRDYARQKLRTSSVDDQVIRRRHAAWYIRYALYHPGVLEDDVNEAPDLDQTWPDTVAGIKWAANHDPELAAQAILLAHTERPALIEEIGQPLIEAIETYLVALPDQAKQAIFHELVGDLYLLQINFVAGAAHFDQASILWQEMGEALASSKARLRVAGVHLLRQDPTTAAEAARQAQALLQNSVPIAMADLDEARTLFYWFNMIYNPLVRWEGLPEEDVVSLAQLAAQTNQPLLKARGLHIYRLYCTTTKEGSGSIEKRQQGRQLALQAYELWRACGRMDRADDEISFTKYQLSNRYSHRTAVRFAQRRSRTTPRVSPSQIRLIKNEGMRWWLQASETQRIKWLSWMLPRYLGSDNRPKHPKDNTFLSVLMPDTRAYRWVEDILNIGVLGGMGRRLMIENDPPPNHILNGPEWRVLSGQRVLSLEGDLAKKLVAQYINVLEAKSGDY